MSRKDYIEIGGIMTRKNGKKYECVLASQVCKGCYFEEKTVYFCAGIKCAPYSRTDNQYVHFIRRKDLEAV